MKPAWDKLMKAFEGSQDALVADVDCTAAGKSICADNGVQGYPSIKWGSVGSLEDYQGGRDFDALKKFADENLKPVCSLAHMELCGEEEKFEINTLVEMDMDSLKKAIEQQEGEIKAAEKAFEEGTSNLQSRYQELQKQKDAAIAAVKDGGLGKMKSVRAHRAKAQKTEL